MFRHRKRKRMHVMYFSLHSSPRMSWTILAKVSLSLHGRSLWALHHITVQLRHWAIHMCVPFNVQCMPMHTVNSNYSLVRTCKQLRRAFGLSNRFNAINIFSHRTRKISSWRKHTENGCILSHSKTDWWQKDDPKKSKSETLASCGYIFALVKRHCCKKNRKSYTREHELERETEKTLHGQQMNGNVSLSFTVFIWVLRAKFVYRMMTMTVLCVWCVPWRKQFIVCCVWLFATLRVRFVLCLFRFFV